MPLKELFLTTIKYATGAVFTWLLYGLIIYGVSRAIGLPFNPDNWNSIVPFGGIFAV